MVDGLRMPKKSRITRDAAQFKLGMPTHAIKVYLRAVHKFFVDTVSHELGRGLDCGFDCGVGRVREGGGNVVLVPADALVLDRRSGGAVFSRSAIGSAPPMRLGSMAIFCQN